MERSQVMEAALSWVTPSREFPMFEQTQPERLRVLHQQWSRGSDLISAPAVDFVFIATTVHKPPRSPLRMKLSPRLTKVGPLSVAAFVPALFVAEKRRLRLASEKQT